jgi:(p)ppGpp synthase/HD superfamily hydrolase
MAIRFAIKTHEVYQKQKRKGKDIAYVVHPMTAGMILAAAGAPEDVVIAGILHDTIEDSIEEKKVTYAMIAERFGDTVADLVLSVTEVDRSLLWEERKRIALEKIADLSYDSLLIKSADVISNMAETLDDHAQHGDDAFSYFNAPKEKMLTNQLSVITAIIDRWEDNPLIDDLRFIEEKVRNIMTS